MKKFALLIAAVMLAMSFSVSAAPAESEAETDERYTKAVYLLEALGVNYFSNADNRITYNIFNDALYIALNGKNTHLNITEMTGVSCSSEFGAAPITYDDAVRSLVNITGYKLGAKAAGGNAAAYVGFAGSKGILKGVNVKQGENISARDAAVMLYNAFDVDILQAVYTGSQTEYKSYDGETLLYKYRKLRKGSGVVEANEYTSLYSSNDTAAGSVKIGGVVYSDPSESAADLLTYAVEFYYYDNGDNTYEMFLAYRDGSKDREIVIDGNFSANIGRRVYYYTENGREQYKDIPKDAAVIYNGAALYEYDNSIFDFTSRQAVLVDNNNDGKIEAVLIKEYTNWYISRLDIEHGIIYDGLDREELDINDDKYDRIRIFGADGNQTNIYTLEVSDVLSVYKSGNGTLLDIYVRKKQVAGKIEAVAEDGRDYIVIDGEKYYLSPSFVAHEKQNAVIGTSANFYLDTRGEVAYMKQLEGVMKYGYIMNRNMKTEEDDKIWIKLLSQDGRIYSYRLKERAKIDGQSYKKSADVLRTLADASLIRYDVNESDEIFIIDTDRRSAKESDETLCSFGPKQSLTYNSSQGSFEGKIRVGDSTLVFFCPSEEQGGEGFGIVNHEFLKTSTTYSVRAFSASKTNYVPDAIVIDEPVENYFKVDNLSKSYVIADIATVANDDSEAVYQLTVFNKINQSVVMCANPSVGAGEDLHTGDVINAAYDNDGNFCDIVKVYDSKTNTMISSDVISAFAGTDYTSRCRMISGNVYFNNGTTLGISEISPDSANIPDRNELEYVKVNDSLGVIVDSNYDEKDSRHIRRVAMAEVHDYINYKSCAKVFLRMDQSASTFIVIYQ